MKDLDWTEVQTVIEVAKSGSLSGASRQLGVNHSTVLRRVHSFEAHQRVQMFSRIGNRYELSSHGRVLLSDLEQVHQNMKALQRRIAEYDTELKGVLAVTTTDNIYRSFLHEPLLEFAQIHTGIQLNLLVGSQLVNTSELEAEVAIRPADKVPDGHFGKRLFDLEFGFYATPAFINQLNIQTVTSTCPWIGFGEPLCHARVGRTLAQFMTKKPRLVASSFDVIASAADQGLGVAFIPRFIAKDFPQLKAVESEFEFQTPVFAFAPDESALSSRVKHLMAFLDNYFSVVNAIEVE